MHSKIWRMCLLGAIAVLSPLNVPAQTGNPYYNVMDPTYGAKCDGIHNDTVAFQNALTAAQNNGGGLVFVPSSGTGHCLISGQLTLAHGVTLSGPPMGLPNQKPILEFTGSTSPAIDMRGTNLASLRNLNVEYSNPALTGAFIDMSAPVSNFGDSIMDCDIQGTLPNAVNANPLVNMNNLLHINIERNSFQWGVNAIVGQTNSGGFANGIRVRDNFFQWITGAMILNLGESWTVEGNIFEMEGATSGNPVPIDANFGGGCKGCLISGNWIGDTPSAFASWVIQGNFIGTSIVGNHIEGANSGSQANGIWIGSSSWGLSIAGNHYQNVVTSVGIPNTGTKGILNYGNAYVSQIGNPSWGTPTTGILEDINDQPTFYGSVGVNGTLTKTAGNFRIDDPLDPNKYLSHSFVESPDMMNIYNGVVRLDAHGQAEVKLPKYFEALNQDFRYQLTPIGGYAPLYVAREIRGNSFRIEGGKAGLKVSWQVTGIRHDPYANSHRIKVESDKPRVDQLPTKPDQNPIPNNH